jgi:cytosine/adenosine deaminase-related metal-dependent hydrolase
VILRALLAAAVAVLCCAPALAARPLVLAGGTVVDGYGNPPLRNGVIVIEGERISAVGTLDSVVLPQDAELVSTEGMTVLPGLWDMQVHVDRLGHGDEGRWNETYAPIAARVVGPLAASQLLQAGVTSARAMAAPLAVVIGLRERVAAQRIPGPTLFVGGPQLVKVVAPGADSWQWAVKGADEGRAKVARLAAAGVDFVLLGGVDLWDEEELKAVIGEARIRGLGVFAAGERTAAVERGLAAGVDGFVGLDLGALPDFPAETLSAIAARTASSSQPALSWSPAISGVLNYEDLRRNPEPLDDPAAVAGLPPLVAADVLASLRALERIGWYDMPAARAPTLCTKLGQLRDAGVRLVLGSDSGAPAQLHTRAAWQEVDFWVRECGIEPLRAIQAATHDAAAAMRVEHESGTISPGKYADIIAVRGDVLRNPALLQRVDIVVRHGQRYR